MLTVRCPLAALVLVGQSLWSSSCVAQQSTVASDGQAVIAESPLLFEDDFENGMRSWIASDRALPTSVWSVVSGDRDGQQTNFLRVSGMSKYEPPFRSPHSVALIQDLVVGDFELSVRVQNTNPKAGAHRDLCFFWGYQDPAHFYYAHLGAKPDPHSSQIFIVDGAPRRMITQNESPGIPWTDGWHDVRVSYQADSGDMRVYFDDMQVPVYVAKDTSFRWGRIGLGTFDDNGNFDEVRVRGTSIHPIPAGAKLP